MPLLAIAEDDRGQLRFVRRVDDIGGGGPGLAHAHVERAVLAEGEAALRLIELEGGHADIEHDAIGPGSPAAASSASILENSPCTSVSRPP